MFYMTFNKALLYLECLQIKSSCPLNISLVNMNKSAITANFLTLTKEISKRKEYLIANKTERLKAEGL